MEKAPQFHSVYPFKLIYSPTCYFKTNYVGSIFAKNYNMQTLSCRCLLQTGNEYFNDFEILAMYICIKCIKIESKKVVDDFPAIRSLKVESIIHTTLLTV
jgi:hypothetical protein